MKTQTKNIKKEMMLKDVQWEENNYEMTMFFEVQSIVTQILVN